ncbi:hypothetical protein BDZ94DRAFT_1249858 [Collybia nuda]|uniref:F-box domain-containing protein n=1 Tax=Collybia nuda TaxID=64659 RepID=A0A9P6CP11_9AGAR|nr:hypothetical protein BDZ94DRAFT_1249858 [Collybia nuda]
MHPCLNISEVLSNIFKYVLEDVPSGEVPEITRWPEAGSMTLAALARTCKAFSEPALNVLWYRQPSLAPLLNCLPVDCYQVTEIVRGDRMFINTVMTITRDLTPSDFERVRHHAKRIRSIGFSYPASFSKYKTPHRLDPQVLCTVRDATRGHSRLLPSLKHLRIALREFGEEVPTAYAELVVGSSVQTICLSFIDYSDEPLPTESNWKNIELFLLSPSLMTLTNFTISIQQPYPIPVYMGSPSTIKSLSESYGHLEVLDIPPIEITHDVLINIATMGNLKTLKCSIDSAELSLFSQTATSPDHFPTLLALSIDIPHLHFLKDVLKRPGFRCLRSIEILRRGDIDRWDLDSFFDIFRYENTIPRITSINLLKVTASFPDLPSLHCNVSPITTQTLVPLLSRNMKSLNIDLRGTTELNNRAISDLAEAWPNLELLRLTEASTETYPSVTIEGITTLISMCPNLRTLSLRFDAKEIGPIITSSQANVMVHGLSLRHLDVCTSLIIESTPWIHFLPRIFPNLWGLEIGWVYILPDGEEDTQGLQSTDGIHYHCWEHVRHSLLSFMTANARGNPRGTC